MTVLILGGTNEARSLAAALDAENMDFFSSLAGRVSRPRLPVGEVRSGGFGGVDGLVECLQTAAVTAVVDATHPFASKISAHAVTGCSRCAVPLLRLARPGWGDLPGADRWHWADSHDAGAAAAARLGSTILLTIGRQPLNHYLGPLRARRVFARVVDPVEEDIPSSWQVILDRGPYSFEGELSLMKRERIDVVVTKDSGGGYTRAKLDAADELGTAVVIVRRPTPEAGGQVQSVSDVDAAVQWLQTRRR